MSKLKLSTNIAVYFYMSSTINALKDTKRIKKQTNEECLSNYEIENNAVNNKSTVAITDTILNKGLFIKTPRDRKNS